MAIERTAEAVIDMLYAQAKFLWGEADAERQRDALHATAEEMLIVDRCTLPPDLEPRFFT